MYREHTPVLIVGGGLTGLSTSLFLSWHGVPSLLVERHPRRRDRGDTFQIGGPLLFSPSRMLATVRTCAVLGSDGHLQGEQIDIARQGLPRFLIVGLPDDAVV